MDRQYAALRWCTLAQSRSTHPYQVESVGDRATTADVRLFADVSLDYVVYGNARKVGKTCIGSVGCSTRACRANNLGLGRVDDPVGACHAHFRGAWGDGRDITLVQNQPGRRWCYSIAVCCGG